MKHLKTELAFYNQAFADNKTRRDRKYSWETKPSRTLKRLVRNHGLARAKGGASVLDIGCGDGRHTELFLSLGYEVVGVDFSPAAIRLCRKKFRDSPKAKFHLIDVTRKHAFAKLGQFDVIVDWSVLDHIRREYLSRYIQNITLVLRPNGHLFLTEFTENLPGLFRCRKHKLAHGHYSRGYTLGELRKLFGKMRLIDSAQNILEDKINQYRFHTCLLRKSIK